MRAYGVNPRVHQGCCPGHDVFSRACYRNRRSKKAQTRDTKIAHRIERRRVRRKLRCDVD